MIRVLTVLFLLVPGMIHLMPVTGLLGAGKLTALYGIAFDDTNLLILMQHRAVLFALLGAFLVVAAFRPRWRAAAIVAGAVSAASFVALALAANDYNDAIQRVVIADIVALACLAGAALLEAVRPGRPARG